MGTIFISNIELRMSKFSQDPEVKLLSIKNIELEAKLVKLNEELKQKDTFIAKASSIL